MRIEPKEPATLPADQKSLGELFASLSKGLSALIRQEVQLAKTELAEKAGAFARNIGLGAALLGVAAFLGIAAFFVLLLAAIYALSLVLQPWAAALVVAGVLLVIAAIAAVIGLKSLKKAKAPVPQKTIETLKETPQWLKNQVK